MQVGIVMPSGWRLDSVTGKAQEEAGCHDGPEDDVCRVWDEGGDEIPQVLQVLQLPWQVQTPLIS